MCVIVSGVAAFHYIEGWSLTDSIFMVAITLSTVGYGEVHPLSPNGRIVAIILILFGITIAGYTGGTFIIMLV